MFVDHKEIFNLVFSSAETFEDTDVFAGSPDCEDGNFEARFFLEEEGEFGEDWVRIFSDGGFEGFESGV
jgi:hypothetical protein